VERSNERGREVTRAVPTDSRLDPPTRSQAQRGTAALGRELAVHETMHLCRLSRPWTCNHCRQPIGKNELAQVHVKAGVPHNLIYHEMCEPFPHPDG
jgi:hypothetical protein